MAIFILLLICVFLFREAAGFLPEHHRGLTQWRQTGQEYVDFLKKTVNDHTRLAGKINISYIAEVNRTSLDQQRRLNSSRTVLQRVKASVRREKSRLDKDREDLEYAQEDLVDLNEELQDPDVSESDREEINEELVEAKQTIAKLTPGIAALEQRVRDGVTAALDGETVWLEQSLTEADKTAVREAVQLDFFGDGDADSHPWAQALISEIDELKKIQTEALVDYKAAHTEFKTAIVPIRDMTNELVRVARDIKAQAVAADSAPKRKAALLAGAELTEDPDAKAQKIAEAQAIVVEEPPFDDVAETYYSNVEVFQAAVSQLTADLEAARAKLPAGESLSDPSARSMLDQFRRGYPDYQEWLIEAPEKTSQWRHDDPYPKGKAFAAFLFGKDWTTNSSWHDFYGLMPLFQGSLIISIIALTVAVPFALAAAIYVNQIATVREQNFIKPMIEFIQAIPSVVLGFFGIMILGEGLRAMSQWELLSWVPGFPMQERLNMLTAGLLLAFMAVPTIFTLCEDALNNVPKAYRSGALALGATEMQTILKILVPTAMSGIIAAVLLGFGRIIGETMVVLLVAGGKIQIPDYTLGLGVVTEAAHTMTGIIAQETGEVNQGSLHWRALFMVGLVLFFISLIVNWTAQIILKRFQRHGS